MLAVTGIDGLFGYLAMCLLPLKFQSCKLVDFYYWCLSLYLHKLGHFYLPQGQALVLAISQFINTSRYSTASVVATKPLLDSILHVLALVVPIMLTPTMAHLVLSQSMARLIICQSVWVYNNEQLVSGSPFSTYAAALEAIGQPRTSTGVRRTIDTGKLFINRYTFHSAKRG